MPLLFAFLLLSPLLLHLSLFNAGYPQTFILIFSLSYFIQLGNFIGYNILIMV